MKTTHRILRPPSAMTAAADRAPVNASRFALGAKTALPVVTSNRTFIQSWMARRAKLAAATKGRAAS